MSTVNVYNTDTKLDRKDKLFEINEVWLSVIVFWSTNLMCKMLSTQFQDSVCTVLGGNSSPEPILIFIGDSV